MSTSAQNGKLMVGGIGTLILGALLLLANFVGALNPMGGARGEGAGIVGLIILVAFIALLIMGAIGWFGAQGVYGGTNAVAGVFGIIAVVGILMLVAGFLMLSPDILAIGALAFGLGLGLKGVFGGIGLLGGQAQGSAGPIKMVAAIVLLVGGIAMTYNVIGLLMRGLPLMDVTGPIQAYGYSAGLILAGLTLIMSRTADA